MPRRPFSKLCSSPFCAYCLNKLPEPGPTKTRLRVLSITQLRVQYVKHLSAPWKILLVIKCHTRLRKDIITDPSGLLAIYNHFPPLVCEWDIYSWDSYVHHLGPLWFLHGFFFASLSCKVCIVIDQYVITPLQFDVRACTPCIDSLFHPLWCIEACWDWGQKPDFSVTDLFWLWQFNLLSYCGYSLQVATQGFPDTPILTCSFEVQTRVFAGHYGIANKGRQFRVGRKINSTLTCKRWVSHTPWHVPASKLHP